MARKGNFFEREADVCDVMSERGLLFSKVIAFICVFMCLVLSISKAEVVYKRVDQNGLPVFSDREDGVTEKINIRSPNSVGVVKSTIGTNSLPSENIEEEVTYKVAIVSPEKNQTYRNNQAIRVSVDLVPRLRKDVGHRMRILVDGTIYGEEKKTPFFMVSGLHRGSHTVVAQIVDRKGREMARSEILTFFVHKSSILNKALTNRKL